MELHHGDPEHQHDRRCGEQSTRVVAAEACASLEQQRTEGGGDDGAGLGDALNAPEVFFPKRAAPDGKEADGDDAAAEAEECGDGPEAGLGGDDLEQGQGESLDDERGTEPITQREPAHACAANHLADEADER